jgi:protein SCO1/2
VRTAPGTRWPGPAAVVLALLALATGLSPPGAAAHPPGPPARLPRIGAAPAFTLTAPDGRRLALEDLRGKVVVVTFIYASCADACPLLTAKLVSVQRRLDRAAGTRVAFAAITVDPERDTPEALRRYAAAYGADPPGWALLTGSPQEIQAVARAYGVYHATQPAGDVDHTVLTSLVDRRGILRVQYLGVRFDPDELLGDLRSLLREAPAR